MSLERSEYYRCCFFNYDVKKIFKFSQLNRDITPLFYNKPSCLYVNIFLVWNKLPHRGANLGFIFFERPNFMLPGGSIRKEVISDLKGENQFFSKEIWDSIWLISRERSVNRFKNWFLPVVPLRCVAYYRNNDLFHVITDDKNDPWNS